ncbi:hypothetical protein [Carnobacterium sp. TMP28]|uniref:hypothetical protein n=1 Tax=Carnobacterium sp. TMP28 TaxID=3397060 RepID=UPI0039E17ADC
MKQQLLFDFKKISYDRMYLGLFLLILFIFLSPVIDFRKIDTQASKLIEISDQIVQTREGIEQMKEFDVPLAIKDEEERLALLEAFYAALSSKQSEEITKTELAYEKKILEQIESGSLSGTPLIEQRKTVAKLEHLVANNLIATVNFDSSVPAINFISNDFQLLIPFTMILIFPVLIFSRIHTDEKVHGTRDFVNMTPISFEKMILSKLVVSVLFAFLYFIFSVGLAIFILSFRNGIGSLNYPIPISKDGLTVSILTTGQFLSQVSILLVAIYTFISSLSILISRFTHSFLVQTVVLLMVIMLPSSPLFTAESAIANIAHFLPFSYFDLSKVLTYGDSFSPSINEYINFTNGLICLMSYAVLCLLVSWLMIKKKGRV